MKMISSLYLAQIYAIFHYDHGTKTSFQWNKPILHIYKIKADTAIVIIVRSSQWLCCCCWYAIHLKFIVTKMVSAEKQM